MATLPESVDYTDKDFDALRARLIALIKSVFPDWTDFDVASFGNLLVELYAYVGDVLTFYQDSLARESRLVTCGFVERHENVLLIGPTGTGRSHIAQALGHRACRAGYTVLYVGAQELLKQLRAARADGSSDQRDDADRCVLVGADHRIRLAGPVRIRSAGP